MDPVNRLNHLMEALRRRLVEPAKRTDAARAGRTAPESGPAAAAGRPSLQQLRQTIQERVRAIEPDASDHRRRVGRVFLESVIAWEFGDQLLLDSRLERLIEHIQENLETDPELDRDFQALLAQLSDE